MVDGQAACAMCGREEAVIAFEYEGVYNKAVISLARIRIHKFTKGHCGTVPIGWCLLCIFFFFVVLGCDFVGEYTDTQIHK